MSNILEVRGLNKSYAAFSLSDVSFEIPQGYIMGFIGPNGAGKTTTIKSILNVTAFSGDIKLFGMDNKENTGLINEQVGVVMDTPLYVEDWTANDVESAVKPFYRGWDAKKYDGLLRGFGIDRKKKVKELSRGMKVKLSVSVALSHNARLLILDEPTSGLDPVARDELCELLADFVTDETKGVLFSTHITADLEKIADYITFILDGRIVFTGPKEQLMEKYVSVKGGLDKLTTEHKKRIIGLREFPTGFEGLAELGSTAGFPRDWLVEPVSLDDIIIFMNKGAKNYE